MLKPSSSLLSFSVNGSIAGAFSAFVFTYIHEIFISDIWFSITTMLISGALCGFSIAWTFHLLFKNHSLAEWWKYNLIYLALFILLGTLSAIIFKPVTTVAQLITNNEPPRELIIQAAPMTIAFTLGSSLLISMLYSKKILHHLAVFLTCTLLVALLGLNVSFIGLVYFPNNMFYLILEMYLLMLVITLVYAGAFMLIQWKNLKTV